MLSATLESDAVKPSSGTETAPRWTFEVVEERLLAVADVRVVLDVGVAGVALDGLGRPALVEHEVVGLLHVPFVDLGAFVGRHLDTSVVG